MDMHGTRNAVVAAGKKAIPAFFPVATIAFNYLQSWGAKCCNSPRANIYKRQNYEHMMFPPFIKKVRNEISSMCCCDGGRG